ncbi:carbohydrate ABC transporter substrate-binding protein (CUT1 family) [Scopulibacillus darangshiensis]|uniref:Carbohydrate ABC transporter substrate-binding protein (CUT1 family) n=1 Tax=Scopulibacillus darangshiensis TaxID=442528 RepID=A0A4R2P7G2_9BACL|nr:ABC transporter substrate-binding protein [Scopulibacillus darangshiensis]TCP30832.1 carbohydrate ABC transporter substrate-binding protein (CUT1 family) [Scopulibacillus darangshiensis]
MGIGRLKKLAAASLVAGCMLISTACSDGSSGTSDGNDKVISITFRSSGGTNTGLTDWLKQDIIPQFKKKHPDAEVKLTPIQASEGNYFAKVALMLKSKNTAPDIVTEDTFMINSDASAGYLEPLDNKVKGWSDWDKFNEKIKQGVIAQNGKVYGVPYNTDSRGLWYNKDLFKKAGLPIPWEPKNWEDILQAAKTIKEKFPKDVVPLWMNSGKATGEATSMQTFEMLLYGTKDPLYDKKSKKWIVKSDGLLDTFKFIDKVYEQKLGPSLSKVLNGQGGQIAYQQLMPKGKLAIGLDGIWQTGTWRKGGPAPWPEAFNVVGFAPMPTQHGEAPGKTTMSGGWAWSIPKKSDNKKLAWEFIEFASSKENNLKQLLKERSLTPREDVAKDPEYKKIPMFKEATELLKYAHFRPAVDKYPSVSTQIQSLVEGVVTGKLSPEQAAKQYQKNVTRIVGKDNVTTR